MSCVNCPHCRKIKRQNERIKKFEEAVTIICKCCQKEKEKDNYAITRNKSGFSYRRVCKECTINKQKKYMKVYHKTYYMPVKQKILEE